MAGNPATIKKNRLLMKSFILIIPLSPYILYRDAITTVRIPIPETGNDWIPPLLPM
jgi:hypothetical protein